MTWWPGRDSIDSTGWWSHFYFWLGIACLFLLAISEVASYRYGLRKDELAEARRKAEVEALQGELSKAKMARNLAPEKRAEILACLQTKQMGAVFVRPARLDAEATTYGGQIESLLREAGFEIREWPTGPSISWSVPGAFLIVKDLKNSPAHAVSIQNCFNASGIVLEGYADAAHPEDAVSVAIGAR